MPHGNADKQAKLAQNRSRAVGGRVIRDKITKYTGSPKDSKRLGYPRAGDPKQNGHK